ncbi:SWFGD domain-containing protein [Rhizobium sp. TRM96647]|uniref:SWFGD domain-containing protein n=1 Tax=unclassified Rhizobium TaxID=2613769 RepID=UPI0021E75842|nr:MULTISPECIES: SWFGD domain-containing protein [unclassified Rhizobium]MCV3738615.1 SWFGD domain-containing protein [Rhizobium sp. TRM96647]MCV3760302.1 SWFGD domain-containing protein [Rhizobium sp. TRM96650]
MARDWENRDANRRYGDRGDEWRSERDWSDRASDEARSWFGDEDAERRRMMDDRTRNERENRRHSGGDDRREDRYGMRPFAGRDTYLGYDWPWSKSPSGGYDRDTYGYPRRQSDDRWRSGSSGRDYRSSGDRSRWDNGRGFFERAGDEVASWFGDEDASRRREMDARHRGRGPKNYTRSDERIAEEVNDQLADDAHIDASDIEVSVSSGEVTLNGTVTERFAKRHAEDIVERVSGVKHVQNNLRVSEQQTTLTTQTESTRTDQSTTGGVGSSATFRH